MTGEFIERFTQIVPASALMFDEPMKKHTTFGIGGPADILAAPENAEMLAEAVACCRAFGVPWMVVGRGSNLLVGDKGIRGVVFRICHTMDEIHFEPTDDERVLVTAGAGVLLSRLARAAADYGLSGLEFASGIPGTFGGAVTMNAGAYGGEMKNLMVEVKVLTTDGELRVLNCDALEMGYRTSIIQKKNMVILEGTMVLKTGLREEINGTMAELNRRRREKQPLEYPSAGSTFKRPEGYFAGKLIEDAGLKGASVGGAQVSQKHSGFVINTGNATASDVLGLIEHIQSVVEEKFGVCLEPEIRRIGEF